MPNTFCGSRSIFRLLPPNFPRTLKATCAILSGGCLRHRHRAYNDNRVGYPLRSCQVTESIFLMPPVHWVQQAMTYLTYLTNRKTQPWNKKKPLLTTHPQLPQVSHLHKFCSDGLYMLIEKVRLEVVHAQFQSPQALTDQCL